MCKAVSYKEAMPYYFKKSFVNESSPPFEYYDHFSLLKSEMVTLLLQ